MKNKVIVTVAPTFDLHEKKRSPDTERSEGTLGMSDSPCREASSRGPELHP